MITRINESQTLLKHISCECKCKCNVRKCNSKQKLNNEKRWCKYKNPEKHHACKKCYIWNPRTCTCKNG